MRLLRLFLLLLLVIAPASAQDKRTARPEIGKPVQEAQQLLKQKKFKEALARLAQADKVADESPYERYIIAATRAAIELDAGDEPAAIDALEAVLATGVPSPGETQQRLAVLVQLEFRAKDPQKTIAIAERYIKAGGSEDEPRRLMAQAYFIEKDFASSAKVFRDLVASQQRAGKLPSEDILLTLAACEFEQKNNTGFAAALEDLVSYYPKPRYWSDLLLAVAKQPGFAKRLTLDLDRLRLATGAIDQPAQLVEAAELALAEGFPGDAKAFLAKGFGAGAFGTGATADRPKRLADMAARQASDDVKLLPQAATEAASASDGTAWEKLGEAEASYGDGAAAIAALEKGIAKGGLKYPDDAKLHLGMAYLQAGQAAKAKSLFAEITGADGTRDLARLWLIARGVK